MTELPIAARIVIWAACKSPTRHIRNDCLENVGYTALHYGIGGAMHPATLQTIALRSGLRLGIVRPSA